jgi:hypothetical protein
MHPYAHPHHLKLLKHFVYIQYGCGMQSMGVCSLNHDTATSYRLKGYHISPKNHPHLNTYYGNNDAHMPIHSISRCYNSLYIQYGCGMQSMGVFSLNHDTATSYRAGKLASYGQNGRRSINNHDIPLGSHCL